jgi:hypothetical protein
VVVTAKGQPTVNTQGQAQAARKEFYMKTAWEMTQAEREALWAANDAKYRFEDDDPWEAARDMMEERRCVEGPAFCC